MMSPTSLPPKILAKLRKLDLVKEGIFIWQCYLYVYHTWNLPSSGSWVIDMIHRWSSSCLRIDVGWAARLFTSLKVSYFGRFHISIYLQIISRNFRLIEMNRSFRMFSKKSKICSKWRIFDFFELKINKIGLKSSFKY